MIWNPGQEKGDALADMPEGGWKQMLCVEAAQVLKPIELPPGETWAGMQTLELL